MKKHACLGLALAAATLLAPPAQATGIEHNASADVYRKAGRTILVFATNGTFTVREPGEVELLLVGGGGAGGTRYVNGDGTIGCGSGGGGGGGVITNTVTLAAGTYSVEVGAGGQVGENRSGRDGGDGRPTTLSRGETALFTAYGGGGGAGGGWWGAAGRSGASGGGGSYYAGTSQNNNGGSAIYADHGNLGHPGGTSLNLVASGGGGGAGENGGDAQSDRYPGKGGDGVEVQIFSTNLWYGGGGSGWWADNRYPAEGGKGGGGKSTGTSRTAGENGKGGGGSGEMPGGSGIAIFAFVPSSLGDRNWLECTGGDEVLKVSAENGRDEVRIFRQSGTLTVDGPGTMEVLAVGGGGGGGVKAGNYCGAAGGGAGGVVHYGNFHVAPGIYEIVIGEGGGVSTNGFPTRGLGITAFGGGAGDNCSWYGLRPSVDGQTTDGASGGGGATHDRDKSVAIAGGKAIYSDYCNLGNRGGLSGPTGQLYSPAGGGGAVAPGGDGNASGAGAGAGGDGYPCSITGTETYYGGGGAGWNSDSRWQADGGRGGGGSSRGGAHAGQANTGGGGSGCAAGGSGVFIVRYHLKPLGTTIIIR